MLEAWCESRVGGVVIECLGVPIFDGGQIEQDGIRVVLFEGLQNGVLSGELRSGNQFLGVIHPTGRRWGG